MSSPSVSCLCDVNGPYLRRALLVLSLVWALQVLGVCRTLGDFWFEDDAPHRVFVRDHTNPLAYFGPTLVSELSLGHSVTPWFPFTFWIDHQLDPLDPFWAYLHTALSLLATVWGLYALFARWMRWWLALAGSCLWLFLPSTVVITEFLSTRHYLEGLLISLASVTFCLYGQDATGRKRLLWTFAAAGTYLLACTTKELYVSATWFVLLALYVHWRRWGAALGVVGCGALYAAYRLWSLGLVGKNLSAAFAERYHLFVARWPFMLSGNHGGYLLVAVGGLLMLYLLWKRRFSWFEVLFGSGLLVILLVTIFPVSANITDQYTELGTWYRVAFLFHTAMLALGLTLVDRLSDRRLQRFLLVVAAVVVLPGGIETSKRWDKIKADYTADAAFYRQYPDRLLYSPLPAPWFMYGIHRLYTPDAEPHYLTWRVDNATPLPEVTHRLQRWSEVWVATPQGYRADSALHGVISRNLAAGTTPLHQGWVASPQKSH